MTLKPCYINCLLHIGSTSSDARLESTCDRASQVEPDSKTHQQRNGQYNDSNWNYTKDVTSSLRHGSLDLIQNTVVVAIIVIVSKSLTGLGEHRTSEM